MVNRFFDNQLLVADNQAKISITTDPMSVGDFTQGCSVLTVHHLSAGGGNTSILKIFQQNSNDGSEWVEASAAFIEVNNSITVPYHEEDPLTTTCAFIRFRAELDPGTTANDAAITAFDLSVRFSQT